MGKFANKPNSHSNLHVLFSLSSKAEQYDIAQLFLIALNP